MSSGRTSLGKQSKKARIQGQSHGVAMRGSRRYTQRTASRRQGCAALLPIQDEVGTFPLL